MSPPPLQIGLTPWRDDAESAEAYSVTKAKQIIDEQGDHLFEEGSR